jgi:hypothetical protein
MMATKLLRRDAEDYDEVVARKGGTACRAASAVKGERLKEGLAIWDRRGYV